MREEFWYIVSGKGKMKIDGSLWYAKPQQYFHIKKNSAHQMINDGEEDVVAYEMQFGVCSEDDLTRIEDQYGRN
jgi:mannose-6-phosphate isomerase-like protein (cupin superfamily)